MSTDRTWEVIKNYNIGLDFGFLDNRLTGIAELFWKKCNNMLIVGGFFVAGVTLAIRNFFSYHLKTLFILRNDRVKKNAVRNGGLDAN